MSELKGKTAFISGGSRGIGRSICLTLAEEGSDIIFTYNLITATYTINYFIFFNI